jgi:hypothetical protein
MGKGGDAGNVNLAAHHSSTSLWRDYFEA